ncbi:MAG: DUF502 domain-containing protein [Alphaproteobacteria bacterium]|nr:DUF502 domain-containing protein [Alphaproteobacteria bacterium]
MSDDELKRDGGPGPPRTAARATSLSARILHRLRNYMIAGILVTAPIGLTVWLSWLFVTWIDDRVMPLVPLKYNPEAYLPFAIPGLGLIIVLIGLVLIGALTANLLGRFFLRIFERVLERMPIIRGIHATFKQVFETLLSHQSEAFRQVVLVEYPRRGIWALGFLTGETLGEVQNLTAEKVLNIFLPTTPNPTSGFLLFLPEDDVVVLDMTVEEGIKMVMSGGIVTPEDLRPLEVRNTPRVSAKIFEDLDILRERHKGRDPGNSQPGRRDQPDRA